MYLNSNCLFVNNIVFMKTKIPTKQIHLIYCFQQHKLLPKK